MSSSVCRLPFIRHSTRPSRTSRTAAAADASLCGASTISIPERSRSAFCATARMRCPGPTSTGAISPIFAASIAPVSEAASQGCTTAVGTAGSVRARASRRS
jgi:hypothetical protein